MMARLHEGAFDDPAWIFEIKWDGYRAVAEVEGFESRLYSRNGLSFQNKYPIVFEALKKIKRRMVLDGEIVAFNDKGVPDFQLLQQYGQRDDVPLVYYVFDILSLDGESLMDRPLLERKEILKEILRESETIHYCDHIAEQGKAFFKAMGDKGLEGMIAKKADSGYYPGRRSESWLKIKQVSTWPAP